MVFLNLVRIQDWLNFAREGVPGCMTLFVGMASLPRNHGDGTFRGIAVLPTPGSEWAPEQWQHHKKLICSALEASGECLLVVTSWKPSHLKLCSILEYNGVYILFSLYLYFYCHWKTLFSWHKFHHSFAFPFQKCDIHYFILFFWFRTKTTKKNVKLLTTALELDFGMWSICAGLTVLPQMQGRRSQNRTLMPSCIYVSSKVYFWFSERDDRSSVVLGIGGLGKDCNLERPFPSLSHRMNDSRKRYKLFCIFLLFYEFWLFLYKKKFFHCCLQEVEWKCVNQNLNGNSRSPSVLQVFVEACDMNMVFLVPYFSLFPAGCLMPFSILKCYLIHLIRDPFLEPFFFNLLFQFL